MSMIERGRLRLPEMQRRYVWRSPRVRDLLDSLYRGYPSGAILLWETTEHVPLQDMAVSQQANPYQSTQLLLDGQQRLTSLSAVIRGEPVKVLGRQRPIDILFNLEHPDELSIVTEVDENADEEAGDAEDSSADELMQRLNKMAFVVSTRKLEALPQWVRVSEVFKTDSDREFLRKAGVTSLDDPRAERYAQRLARLRNVRRYVYRMDVLESGMSYNEVTEIFVRVNSLGAKLRSSDLALAQITAKWRNSLAEFMAFQQECAGQGFELEMGIHLKNLMAFATAQSRFLRVGSIDLITLQQAWKEAREGMHFALNFVRSNLGISSPALLSSPFLLIVLGYFGHVRGYALTPNEAAQLRYWALLANAKGRFSRGSSETILDQDLATLKNKGGATELIDRLRLQFGRLDIAPEELEGRNSRSALFKTMFLAFHQAGAKDWRSHLRIALDHHGSQHQLQFHHIFPKAVLRAAGYSSRDADDIANLSFISGKTNRQISDKTPAEYFPAYLDSAGESAMDAQCIPTTGDLLGTHAYPEFLRVRRRQIADRLNAYIGALPAA
ncbi:GmrSD restriction endonuclease domain-containing protein [Thermomonas mangrovi]|uniref:GmrSD restriction endonuclease domain-containing protein n=1 Tax=Thermomonas mangrovi TaxID=2993316 RepID=UPI002307CA1D